jgi:NTP pyrophosphatase (non-canonical NTP hydrolase)
MDTREVFKHLEQFVRERDWSQFHTPENLAKSISIEAAELLERFQWSDSASLEEIKDELADVLTYCFLMAKHYDLDPNTLILEKLEKTKLKYPIEKSKGNSRKYDQL